MIKDIDLISDKTKLNVSLIASCGFFSELINTGVTKDTDRFKVWNEDETRIVTRKGFYDFLKRRGYNLEYRPVVKEY